MEVTIIDDRWVEFKDADDAQIYVQCRVCKRYGAKGWAHICGPNGSANWHFSIDTVKTVLKNQKRNSLKTMGYLSTPNDWVKKKA